MPLPVALVKRTQRQAQPITSHCGALSSDGGERYTLEFIGTSLPCLDIRNPGGMARLLAERFASWCQAATYRPAEPLVGPRLGNAGV